MRNLSYRTLCVLVFSVAFHFSSAIAGISCPESVTASHCDVLSFSVSVDSATDISNLAFSVSTDGPGEVSISSDGRVSYVPDLFVPGLPFTISVSASSGPGVAHACSTTVVITNVAPTLNCPDGAKVVRGREQTFKGVVGIDQDPCDALSYSLVGVSPELHGNVTVNQSTGDVTFAADEDDAEGRDVDYQIALRVSDGHESDTCSFVFTVLHEEAFRFVIQRTNDIFQGVSAKVPILYAGGTLPMGGFDLLLNYDPTALRLLSVTKGNIFSDYGWEFFKTDFDPIDTVSGKFQPGQLRIAGQNDLSEISGSSEDEVFNLGDTIAVMEFLVANDRNLSCLVIPIRWEWQVCEDNLIFSDDHDATYISRRVFDYSGTDPSNPEHEWRAELTGLNDSFPSFGGALPSCEIRMGSNDDVRRSTDFANGGVKIICSAPIDDRGDINLNGISYERADLDLFIQYFLSGIGAFAGLISPDGAIAASEVNGDGFTLTVADLVYFIRVFVGDALPMNRLTHDRDTVTFQQSAGAVFSDLALGAVFFEFEGNPDVQLLDSTMEMRPGLLGGRKRVLIFKIGSAELAPGRILLTDGKILSAQASDFNGSRVVVKLDFATDVTEDENTLLPYEFQLRQNYPNPFNPTTTIEFSITQPGAVELIVYNTLGQRVRTLVSGMYSAGRHTFGWDGTDEDGKPVTSGVYYYRLKAGDVVQSRKMVLLK